jgi:hypothetical protein
MMIKRDHCSFSFAPDANRIPARARCAQVFSVAEQASRIITNAFHQVEKEVLGEA